MLLCGWGALQGAATARAQLAGRHDRPAESKQQQSRPSSDTRCIMRAQALSQRALRRDTGSVALCSTTGRLIADLFYGRFCVD
jgi:hypothetical protein